MKLIRCNREHSAAILDIFNDAILHTTALYDYTPSPLSSMDDWFATKEKKGLPVIGLLTADNQLAGFASYGTFRDRPAYHYTVEGSVYIHKDHRGKGYGKILLPALIAAAREQEYHCMMAGIDSSNAASIRLHEQFGFQFCGRLKEVGYKFGNWLDLTFYQLVLDTPTHPQEK